MALMYWRKYRTEFHIGQSYAVSEATVCRTIRKVEDVLVSSKKFRLPGKKALQPSDTVFEVILVDVSEQPVERPKKPRNALQRQKEATYPKSRADRQSENR
jgi:hypothetical protein